MRGSTPYGLLTPLVLLLPACGDDEMNSTSATGVTSVGATTTSNTGGASSGAASDGSTGNEPTGGGTGTGASASATAASTTTDGVTTGDTAIRDLTVLTAGPAADCVRQHLAALRFQPAKTETLTEEYSP